MCRVAACCRRSYPPRRPPIPQVAQTVGVYYASNAVGRLVGTLASGAAPAPACAASCCRHQRGARPSTRRAGRQAGRVPGSRAHSNLRHQVAHAVSAGALYSYVGASIVDGFGACLMVSVGFAALSCAIDLFLHEEPSSTGGVWDLFGSVGRSRGCYRGDAHWLQQAHGAVQLPAAPARGTQLSQGMACMRGP